MKKSLLIGIAIIAASLTIGIVYAEDQTAGQTSPGSNAAPQKAKKMRKGHDGQQGQQGGEFQQKFRQQIKEHMEQQKAENEDFKKTLDGKSPQEKEVLIKQHRDQQMAENKEFRTKIEADIKSAIKTHRDEMTKKIQSSDMPEADKAEKLKEMQNKWAEKDAFIAKQQSENKAAREQALADGKISKDEMSTLKENRKAQRQENKEYRKEHRKNGKQKQDSNTTDAATPATAQ
jgi:hypothetical protein